MSSADADDLTQDVMVLLLKKAEKYGGIVAERQLWGLAVAILINMSIQGWRKKDRRGETYPVQLEDISLRYLGMSPEEMASRKQITRKLAVEIQKLEDPCKKVINLLLEDMSSAEIQAQLGLETMNATYLRVSRCMEKLRKLLKKALVGGYERAIV
jgi:RNA polymerase sigma factor (sigma-70 family)